MSNAYFFKALGLPMTATEAAVRTRFKLLALIHHPDKADPGCEKEATGRFCEIQQAYEYCMSHLHPNAYDVMQGEDDKDWRGELPAGIFNANSAWWNELKGDELAPVIEWAEACQKAIRFASVKLDELERYILNTGYQKAYDNFESWRRRHIEVPQEEERLQQDIKSLPKHLQAHAYRALDAKRAESYYEQDSYQEDHDEEMYFHTWEAMEGEGALLTGTWRDSHRSITRDLRITPQQYLAQFRKQVAALERRIPTFGIENRSPAEEKRRRARRNATEARLVEAVKRYEKIKHQNAMMKRAAEYRRSINNIGSSVGATAATLKKESVPVSLEDDVKDRVARPFSSPS